MQDLVLLLEPLVAAAVMPSSRSAIFNYRFRQESEIPKLRATFRDRLVTLMVTAITSRRNSFGHK